MKFERYFTKETLSINKIIELDKEQAKHCRNVMRHSIGDSVIVFNGMGGEYHADITEISKNSLKLIITKHLEIENELIFDVSLYVAIPKPKRLEFLVEKAVELGVKEIVPLSAHRAVRGRNDINNNAIQRINTKIIEACKQCKRNFIPEIKNPITVPELAFVDCDVKFILHPTEKKFDFTSFKSATKIGVAVGPEGGFTEDEVEMLEESGWFSWFLGSKILRIETAAVASLSVLNQISANLTFS